MYKEKRDNNRYGQGFYILRSILLYILLLGFISFLTADSLSAKSKTKSSSGKTAKSAKKKSPKPKSKRKTTKKASKAIPQKETKASKSKKAVFERSANDTLSDGLVYSKYNIGKGRAIVTVHVIKADLEDPNTRIAVMKGHRIASGLQKLQDMVVSFDSVNSERILTAVNANFWRAYSNTPIGPTTIDGEMIELKTHKQWSSCFFDADSRPYIDNFFVKGQIDMGSASLGIDYMNKRFDSAGIVIYNKFAGDTIPYVHPHTLARDLNTVLKEQADLIRQDTLFNDSTEIELDTAGLKKEILESNRANIIEYSMRKISLSYLENPAINRPIHCKVLALADSGAVSVPAEGCILSLGKDYFGTLPKRGDTVIISFTTSEHDDVVFFNSVSGTPRLVRDGVAKHEALYEGSRKTRFINRGLPRTSIGTNKDRSMFIMAVVEARSRRERGASLQQMSNIMKQLGAWDAMNLDGGGSSIMVVNGKNVLYPGNPGSSRKLSVGLGIAKKMKAG